MNINHVFVVSPHIPYFTFCKVPEDKLTAPMQGSSEETIPEVRWVKYFYNNFTQYLRAFSLFLL